MTLNSLTVVQIHMGHPVNNYWAAGRLVTSSLAYLSKLVQIAVDGYGIMSGYGPIQGRWSLSKLCQILSGVWNSVEEWTLERVDR